MANILNLVMASDKSGEIRITNVPRHLKKTLETISENIGVDLAPFLKMKLQDISDSYPPDMKKPKK